MTILKNTLAFTGLLVGFPQSLPHLINVNGKPTQPKIVLADTGGFTITADVNFVTVTRNVNGASSVNVYVEFWHTIEAALPPPFNRNATGFTQFLLQGGASDLTNALGGVAAGTQTATSGTVVFSNSNGLTFGMSNSSIVTGSYSQSTAPGGIAAGTQTGTSGTIVFSNSNNVTFGLSNSSVVTASASVAPVQIAVLSEGVNFRGSWSISNAALTVQKMSVPISISASQAVFYISMTDNTSISSNALTLSMGIYTFNASTASLASSGSRLFTWNTGTVFSSLSGAQLRTMPITANLTPGDYLFGFHMRTQNSNNSGTFVAIGQPWLVAPAANADGFTSQWQDGILNATFSTAMPASIAASDANYVRPGGGSLMPGWYLYSTI
jgi:hypothetical protein